MSMTRRSFLAGSAALGGCASVRSDFGGGGRDPAALRIAQIADPQFGWDYNRRRERVKGPDGTYYGYDLRTLEERIIPSVNDWSPDVVLLSGDMTHDVNRMAEDWPRLLREFKAPIVCTPGNHDIWPVSPSVVDSYRGVFGVERSSYRARGFRLVGANSQVWWRKAAPKEMREEHERWLTAELDAAVAVGEMPILATHVPPFVEKLDEPDGYENLPLEWRRDIVEGVYAKGVRFWLCGHLHRLLVRSYRDMMIFNAEACCENFDAHPVGWRKFTINHTGEWTWNS